MPVATTTVIYDLDNPSAQGVANALVTAQLVGAGDRNDAGTVITGTITITTDSNGAFSLALVPSSAYRQLNTYYAVNITNGPSYAIVVPVSASPVSLWDCRVDPATLAPSTVATPPIYLARSERGVANGVPSLDSSGLVPAAQLPTGASTPDATSTVKGILKLTNDLGGTADLPTVPTLANKLDKTLLDAAGDLVVATADNTPTRLPVGADGQMLVVDTAQAGRLKYADRMPPAYPLSADGLIAASEAPGAFTGTFTLGAVWYVRMLVPAGKAITNCVTAVHQAGTLGAGGENSMAVYTDAGVLVAQTTSDNNLWTTTGPKIKALPSPIAAQSVDRYVYVAIMNNGYTANPFFMFIAGSSGALMFNGGFGSGKRRVLTNAGSSSSWVASFNPATDGGTGAGFMPFLALS